MTAEWTTACPDWERRLLAGESLMPCGPLFPDEATACLEVFKQLKIVDAPGSPTIGEACAPWVINFAGTVFGSYDSEAGRRLISEFFLLISKKNSKSTIAAGIMLTLLIRNWRESAELIILAPTIEVANNAYAPARDMIKHDDELSDLLHVQDHVRTITHRVTGATLKVVAADSNTVGGKKASFILIDELHLFGSMAKAENMLREATGGLASRPEGCIIYLTTQSDQPPAGVFLQKLQYARQVRDGKLTDKRFLPVLYEFPKSMMDANEHLNPANFGMVNPNLGYSVDREFLEREFEKAKDAGEGSLRGFMSKFLNVEIGLALLSNRWAGADFWQRQERKGLTLETLIERSDVISIGIDGGGLDDLLGLAVIGRDMETREWLVWCRAWAHPSVLERRKQEAARLMDFAKDGDLVLVQRIGDDVEEVADIVKEIDDTGLLDRVGVDPAGIGSILDAIIARDVEQDKVVGVSQGWRLGGAIKTCERKLAEGGMIHAPQSIMNWCCGNARVEPKGNSILITKQASGSAKIDPLMALFCAVSLMALNPEGRAGSYDFLSNPLVLR
jgi:phage terminase large subunit-like protein